MLSDKRHNQRLHSARTVVNAHKQVHTGCCFVSISCCCGTHCDTKHVARSSPSAGAKYAGVAREKQTLLAVSCFDLDEAVGSDVSRSSRRFLNGQGAVRDAPSRIGVGSSAA
eukprot:642706-Prorocentrum_minimum.AAC.1